MKRIIGIVVCSIVLSFGLIAQPASAEPHGYWMWCRDGSGLVRSVTAPQQCTRGLVKFISFYDGHVGGSIDVFALQMRINRLHTLTQAYNACHARIVCGVILAGVEAFVIGKFRIAYLALRAAFLR